MSQSSLVAGRPPASNLQVPSWEKGWQASAQHNSRGVTQAFSHLFTSITVRILQGTMPAPWLAGDLHVDAMWNVGGRVFVHNGCQWLSSGAPFGRTPACPGARKPLLAEPSFFRPLPYSYSCRLRGPSGGSSNGSSDSDSNSCGRLLRTGLFDPLTITHPQHPCFLSAVFALPHIWG